MLLSALLLMVSGPATGCPRPAVPDAAAARRIAATVIRNRTGRPQTSYDLIIERDPRDTGQWRAYQTPRGARSARGGGGLSFRIDRCTGRVSDLSRQR